MKVSRNGESGKYKKIDDSDMEGYGSNDVQIESDLRDDIVWKESDGNEDDEANVKDTTGLQRPPTRR